MQILKADKRIHLQMFYLKVLNKYLIGQHATKYLKSFGSKMSMSS